MITDGAVITAIDWTKNHVVGKGNVKQFLRGLSSQSMGRGKVGHLYSNGCTVNWSEKSQYKMTSIYDKENDLGRQRKKRLKNASDEDIKYYDDLIILCHENGVAREEHKFKRLFLSKNNLKFYGLFNDSDFEPYLKSVDDVMSRCEVTGIKQKSIADRGVVPIPSKLTLSLFFEQYQNVYLMILVTNTYQKYSHKLFIKML